MKSFSNLTEGLVEISKYIDIASVCSGIFTLINDPVFNYYLSFELYFLFSPLDYSKFSRHKNSTPYL